MKSKPKKGNQLITVRGVLLPMDWDEDGHIISFVLSGTDEKEYQIEVNDKKAELLALLRKEVEVTGLLRERAENNLIVLSNYKESVKGAEKRVIPIGRKGGDNRC